MLPVFTFPRTSPVRHATWPPLWLQLTEQPAGTSARSTRCDYIIIGSRDGDCGRPAADLISSPRAEQGHSFRVKAARVLVALSWMGRKRAPRGGTGIAGVYREYTGSIPGVYWEFFFKFSTKFYLLTIASFRIGVPSILFKIKFLFNNLVSCIMFLKRKL